MRIENFKKHEFLDFSYLTAPNIKTKHAFSTQYDIPCGGKFSEESMSILCNALNISPENVVYNKQIHSSYIQVITTPSICNSSFSILNSPFEADALITKTPGVALMVFTADCVPILLHDPVKCVVGAVHAGWQGTALNIAAAAISKMKSEFCCSPTDIRAAIGPCISKCCFETDADVAIAIEKALGDTAGTKASDRFITLLGNKYMIDLKEVNRTMLISAGVCDISVSDDCTFCTDSSRRYWSHRKHGTDRGSQAAVIIIENENWKTEND